jgi:hypothetical protein
MVTAQQNNAAYIFIVSIISGKTHTSSLDMILMIFNAIQNNSYKKGTK